jgi:hypothetical protein
MRVHAPLSGALEGGMRPLQKVLGRAPQFNWRLPISQLSSYTQRFEQGGRLLPARTNPRVTSPSMKWRGKSNRLGGSVDLGLLHWIPKGLQVLVARMGDLVILSFATMAEREWKPQSWPEMEDDYLYPSQISSHWGRLTPESPACKGRSLRSIRTGVSGSLVTNLRVFERSPEWLWADYRGLHHAGANRVWEAGFFGRSLRLRTKVSGF